VTLAARSIDRNPPRIRRILTASASAYQSEEWLTRTTGAGESTMEDGVRATKVVQHATQKTNPLVRSAGVIPSEAWGLWSDFILLTVAVQSTVLMRLVDSLAQGSRSLRQRNHICFAAIVAVAPSPTNSAEIMDFHIIAHNPIILRSAL